MASSSLKLALFLTGICLQVLTIPSYAQTPGQAASAAAANNVPQACIDASLAIQGSCGSEVQKALSAAGITGVNTNDVGALTSAAQRAASSGKLDAAAASINPSPGCCKAACTFTKQLCGCNQNVVNLFQQTLSVDASTVGRLLSAFAGKCGFPALSRATGNCPATATFSC